MSPFILIFYIYHKHNTSTCKVVVTEKDTNKKTVVDRLDLPKEEMENNNNCTISERS